MSADVAAAALGVLRSVSGLNVYDGYVADSDENAKTISAPLPYVIVFFTPGEPISQRGGSNGRRGVEFQVTGVGETREQASWVAQKAEDALVASPVDIGGGLFRRIRRTRGSQYVGRDDTWNRPDGGPLFNDARRYVTRT